MILQTIAVVMLASAALLVFAVSIVAVVEARRYWRERA